MTMTIKPKNKKQAEAILAFAEKMELWLTESNWTLDQLMKHYGEGYTKLSLEEDYVTLAATHCDVNSTLGEMLIAIANSSSPGRVKIPDSDYTAVAREDKSGVQVGCTFVPKYTVQEVYNLLYQNEGTQALS